MMLPQGYGWDVIYSAVIMGSLFLVIYGACWVLAHWIDRNVKLTLEIVEAPDTEKEETPPVA